MIYVVTSFKVAHGKGKEAVDFVKGASDNFNKSYRLILESIPLTSSIANNDTLMVVNKLESYAAWEKIQVDLRKSSDNPWGMVGGWGRDFVVPGSVVRHIYEVIE